MGSAQSRYLQVSRRAVLKGFAAAAVAAGGVAGCGGGDEQVFGEATGPGVAPTGSAGAAAPTGPPVPDSASMTIEFTFEAGEASGGPVRNPYIAVWIETPGEEMVATVSLWHLQENERWLGELKRWYSVAAGGESTSGATRVPGTYSVQWDCTDGTGTKVAAGQYYVCIEAAREHGPYELIREPVTLGDAPAAKALQPAGELTAASVAYAV